MSVRARPLSPHLQVYRWQLGNSLSILHRATGIALACGLVALAYWLIALAAGDAAYTSALQLFSSPAGQAFLAGWAFSFWYHLLNGVRHLVWDLGYGFERGSRHASGWAVVLGAVALTVGVCWVMWHGARP